MLQCTNYTCSPGEVDLLDLKQAGVFTLCAPVTAILEGLASLLGIEPESFCLISECIRSTLLWRSNDYAWCTFDVPDLTHDGPFCSSSAAFYLFILILLPFGSSDVVSDWSKHPSSLLPRP